MQLVVDAARQLGVPPYPLADDEERSTISRAMLDDEPPRAPLVIRRDEEVELRAELAV